MFFGVSREKDDQRFAQDMFAQAPGIGVANMVDPALHTTIQVGKADASGLVQIESVLKTTGKTDHIIPKQAHYDRKMPPSCVKVDFLGRDAA